MSVYGDRGNVLTLAPARRVARHRRRRARAEPRRQPGPERRRPDLLRRRPGSRAGRRLARLPRAEGRGGARRRSRPARRCCRCAAATSCWARATPPSTGRSCPARACSTFAACLGRGGTSATSLVETDLDGQPRTLVGFENHSGRTYLGAGGSRSAERWSARATTARTAPRARVYRGAIGCYLHGSLLPKNPWLADRLLRVALAPPPRRAGRARAAGRSARRRSAPRPWPRASAAPAAASRAARGSATRGRSGRRRQPCARRRSHAPPGDRRRWSS